MSAIGTVSSTRIIAKMLCGDLTQFSLLLRVTASIAVVNAPHQSTNQYRAQYPTRMRMLSRSIGQTVVKVLYCS